MEILAAAELVKVLIGLVGQGVESFGALQRVSGVIKQRQDAGQDVTKDDLRGSVGHDDDEKDRLEKAIAAA